MTERTHSAPPAAAGRSLGQKVWMWWEHLKFAWACGGSLGDSGRIFYFTALKPSLAFRGWRPFHPARILSFSVKAGSTRRYRVFARDNGLEPGTIVEFFSPKSRIVPANLPPCQPRVIYDIGANIGIASLQFATLYPDARFYGFEPLPANHEVCKLNFQNLHGAQAFPWAVGARTERMTFQCTEDPRGGKLGVAQPHPTGGARAEIEVQVYSILDLIKVKQLEVPDFLKVDVEGAEMDVLRGMGDAVESVRRLFVETHSASLKQECLEWMQKHGFRIWPSSDPTALWGDRSDGP